MLDEHVVPAGWGIRPILFSVGGVDVPAYGFFVGLALVIGAIVYWREAKKNQQGDEHGFYLAIAGLLGGAAGAKILEWIINYQFVAAHFSDPRTFLYGRTIVGGLIGGTIAVLMVKKKMKITRRMGNAFAPAIALGVAIGRIGCFLAGCCYGKPTNMGWGVNFGDGILRYPTQLFESIFMLAMFFYLRDKAKNDDLKPGQLFTELMLSYFIFRFFLEFIKAEPVMFLGLTIFQHISIIVIIYLIFVKEKVLNLISNKK
ncbi:MAG: prolipoprotein diacylglyceryl transferase family protein [Candidatus Paceibacterota bacterium]